MTQVKHMTIAMLIVASNQAFAQSGGLFIEVNGTITPQTPSVNINVYTYWEGYPQIYGVGFAVYDLVATESGFTDNIIHHNWLGFTFPPPAPTNTGTALLDLTAGQLGPNFFTWSSPVLLHTVEWTTDDFTPRELSVSTEIDYIDLFPYSHVFIYERIPDPVNGSVTIQIIPAPSSALSLLGGAGLLGARRRRRQ
ncbi:MAG: PEP-CTERM sorting domain-containing protein [Phycisphaeraceae bacterium]|nr:PEP-CTERM sorting domain-containing protein [Phycisphaerales bacterium]MCB9860056.1 PEP-CTERM sorting domain-containing protein [Phycisphaeraceae bacterium]